MGTEQFYYPQFPNIDNLWLLVSSLFVKNFKSVEAVH